MNILTKTAALTLATAAVMLCDSAAFATDAPQLQRKVSFADLNLNNSKGVQVLYLRLRNAANAVCKVGERGPIYPRSEAKHCAALAMRTTVAEINNPNLTAYYNERVGHGMPEETKVASDR